MNQHTPWQSIHKADAELARLLDLEWQRQEDGLELIASENIASPAVVTVMANACTNKYAEGLPGKRYYGGCEQVDAIEELALTRVKALFGSAYANVQPHSGAQANAAVFLALLNGGDRVLGLDLSHGGHLTHGSPVNFSGLLYEAHAYQQDPETERLNYDAIMKKAKEIRPKLIIAGASAYPRLIDFAAFRKIADEVGAYLMVDMAHIAGLVAAGLHPHPLPHAHVVTSTTHKTLRGPRGGIILWNDPALKINKAVFPGTQGGPLEHIIAAKALCFLEALSPEFRAYQARVIENSQSLAAALIKEGFGLVSGGSDNHLVLINLSQSELSGKDLEEALGHCGITVNKNTVPNERRSPFVTSGLRLGTPAVTSRGLKAEHMKQIARWIARAARAPKDLPALGTIKSEVRELVRQYPLYPEWN